MLSDFLALIASGLRGVLKFGMIRASNLVVMLLWVFSSFMPLSKHFLIFSIILSIIILLDSMLLS
jgi:hypothetical protein